MIKGLSYYDQCFCDQPESGMIYISHTHNKSVTSLPLSTIFPNKFFPLKKFLVEQFHLLNLNWCWHSATAMLAPFATAANTPGFSLASLLCFRLNVACTAGSIYKTPGDIGERLFGSPALAMPLQKKIKNMN